MDGREVVAGEPPRPPQALRDADGALLLWIARVCAVELVRWDGDQHLDLVVLTTDGLDAAAMAWRQERRRELEAWAAGPRATCRVLRAVAAPSQLPASGAVRVLLRG